MDYFSSNLPMTILLIAVGIIIGAALGKILNRGPKSSELEQKLQETQDQFDSYQKDVGDHFQQTAELVNQLTESYRNVHEHLSQGAQTLAKDSRATLTNTEFKALSEPDSQSSQKDSHDNQSPGTETAEAENEQQSSSEKPEELSDQNLTDQPADPQKNASKPEN